MPRLRWSPPALLDVQRIYRFLAVKNLDAARRAVESIREGVNLLDRHPQIGRPSDGMDTEYRELRIGFGDSGYVALYRYESDIVTVLALRHQKEVGY